MADEPTTSTVGDAACGNGDVSPLDLVTRQLLALDAEQQLTLLATLQSLEAKLKPTHKEAQPLSSANSAVWGLDGWGQNNGVEEIEMAELPAGLGVDPGRPVDVLQARDTKDQDAESVRSTDIHDDLALHLDVRLAIYSSWATEEAHHDPLVIGLTEVQFFDVRTPFHLS